MEELKELVKEVLLDNYFAGMLSELEEISEQGIDYDHKVGFVIMSILFLPATLLIGAGIIHK